MANTGALSAGDSGGTQTTTQNPQNSTQASSLGQSQNVQTGTATSLLNNHTGVPLENTNAQTISLTPGAPRTAPPTPVGAHGMNPALLGFSILLFVVAIALFWTTSRPAEKPAPPQPEKATKPKKPVKSTTKKRK